MYNLFPLFFLVLMLYVIRHEYNGMMHISYLSCNLYPCSLNLCQHRVTPNFQNVGIYKYLIISKLSAVHMCFKLTISFDKHFLLPSWSCTDVIVAGKLLDLMCYVTDFWIYGAMLVVTVPIWELQMLKQNMFAIYLV